MQGVESLASPATPLRSGLDFARNDAKNIPMRSMTGYGRGEADCDGVKLSVELNTVNRKQSEIVLNLPRDLTELETRIRQAINARISRGRTNVLVTPHATAAGAPPL